MGVNRSRVCHREALQGASCPDGPEGLRGALEACFPGCSPDDCRSQVVPAGLLPDDFRSRSVQGLHQDVALAQRSDPSGGGRKADDFPGVVPISEWPRCVVWQAAERVLAGQREAA
jgi:hypothetical protein